MPTKQTTFVQLPEVSRFQTRPWSRGFGTDFYGALHVAANYCGLSSAPELFPGVWQHGCIPPWQNVQPEMCIFTAHRGLRCFVARHDQEVFLREAGYSKVKAIGLPIVYTQSEGTRRIPGSLLIMPMHSIPNDQNSSDSDVYIQQLTQYLSQFSTVAACISGRCMDSGLWLRHFQAAGIDVMRGATIDDATSLARIRRLCETFEYVTTNTYGSHVPYALYFGAKVSIWGWSEPLTREYFLRDALWRLFPDAVDRLVSNETFQASETIIGRFRVPPHFGLVDVSLGSSLIGAENKLTPDELRSALRWTGVRRLGAELRRRAWDATPWRVQQMILRRSA